MAEAVDKDIEKEEGQQAAAPGDAGQGASGEATQQDAAAAEAAQPEGAEAAAPADAVARLERELAEEKDRSVRLFADFENFRRRTAKERAETYQRAAEDVYAAILPVVDNFSRAISQAGDDPFAQGVKMVFGQLQDALKKGGVDPIEALGAVFDPAEHEAVAYQPSADAAEGTVIYETRRGYRMGGRVIRPASVIVSSGAPAAPATADAAPAAAEAAPAEGTGN